MVDFIKIEIRDPYWIEHLNNNPLLIWKEHKEAVSHFDIEITHSVETKEYNGILFMFFQNKVDVFIKPHYYFNANKHNANDFTAVQCITVITSIIDDLGITEPDKFRVVNLEFGLNIQILMDIKDFISFLYSHTRNAFINDSSLPFSKKAYRPTRTGKISRFKFIKAYAKCIQYSQYAKENTLRFEVKSKLGSYFNKLGVSNLSDLLRLDVYHKFADELIKEFDQVLLLDNNTTFNNLTETETNKLKEFLNTHYWYKVLQKGTNRNKFTRDKKAYYKLLDKTGFNLHTDTAKRIKNKLDILKSGADLHPPKKVKSGADLHIYIVQNCTIDQNKNKRICPITKMDISMQKEDSFLLSNTGLKYLEKHDPLRFQFLKETLLTNQPNQFEKTIYCKISKQIRNRYFNNIALYNSAQTQLF